MHENICTTKDCHANRHPHTHIQMLAQTHTHTATKWPGSPDLIVLAPQL